MTDQQRQLVRYIATTENITDQQALELLESELPIGRLA